VVELSRFLRWDELADRRRTVPQFYDASQHEVGLGFTVSAYDGTSKVFGFGSKAKKTAIPFGDRIEVRATPAPVAA
jgi:hypothetical protein